MHAIALHRLAYRLYHMGVPVVPQLIDVLIFVLFNSKIHHTTEIGEGTLCAYRGMSVLIQRNAVIGRGVMLGAHVVVGGKYGKSPPVIEDNVYVGANACIIGDLTIGQDAIIGAGAVVLKDVPPGAIAVGNPAQVIIKDLVSSADSGPR